mgnify:CR=1 FL=1
MSTVRIQVRRGTSTDWSTVNPTLAAGEIGFESNTKKVKIGDGTTAWNSLDYISSDVPVIDEIAQDAVNSALTMGDGLSKVYNDAANTITLTANTAAGDNIVKTIDGVTHAIVLSLSDTVNVNTRLNSPEIHTTTLVATDATVDEGSFTTLNVTGNLTVSGTTTTVNSTDLNVSDPMIYIGQSNSSNVLDLGIVGAFDNGTYQHTGLVRDASDGKWKLFSGVTTEPGTTVDFSTYEKDDLEIYWNKLKIFNLFKGPCVYFDLDIVIQNNIDKIIHNHNFIKNNNYNEIFKNYLLNI